MRRILALALGVVALIGCKSATEKQFEREQIIIAPPLEHDPTERVDLTRWWSNGTHLLRLDDNAAYSLYQGANRYARPIERGRWSKQSYALLWLEPYNTIRVEPRRVSIDKVDGKLALLLPGAKMQPMFALPGGPPPVLEDRLIGLWDGALGTLELRSNLRYSLTPSDMTEDVDRRRAYRKGAWRVADNTLILQSDIPGIDPLRLPLKVETENVTIEGPGGELSKADAQASAATAPAAQ